MALFVLLLCPFDISVGIGAFVIGLGQISSFLSLCHLQEFYKLSTLVKYEAYITDGSKGMEKVRVYKYVG